MLNSDSSLMVSVSIFIRYLVGMVTVGWLTADFCDTIWAKVVLPIGEGGTGVRVICDGAFGACYRSLEVVVLILVWPIAMNAGHLR